MLKHAAVHSSLLVKHECTIAIAGMSDGALGVCVTLMSTMMSTLMSTHKPTKDCTAAAQRNYMCCRAVYTSLEGASLKTCHESCQKV